MERENARANMVKCQYPVKELGLGDWGKGSMGVLCTILATFL